MPKTVILTILDGWGIGRPDRTNPIYTAPTPTIKYIESHFPSLALQASGIAIGLPWEEKGNSETSHLVMGAGRVVYQPYPKISLSIKDGSFFNNPTLKQALEHAKNNHSLLHLIGLVSRDNIDASREHLKALIKLANYSDTPYALHLITDGLDSPRESALSLIKEVDPDLTHLASLSGRYYAMDEDEKWDRIKQYYETLTSQNPHSTDPESHLNSAYSRNISDQYIAPTLIGSPRPIKNNDSLIFFNFTADKSSEMVAPFADPTFNEFKPLTLSNLFITSFVSYRSDFSIPVVFPKDDIKNPLSQVIADHNLTQLKISETLKYASLTYFFNGLKEAPFKNEYRVFVPSNNLPRPEQLPELRATDITARLLQSINENVFNLIIINFPNADIIGHTGNFAAAERAVAHLDEQLKKIMDATLSAGAITLIVGSHGNIEQMINPLNSRPETNNTTNPVPFYLINQSFNYPNRHTDFSLTSGIISDIAPTILNLLEIPPPLTMTGQSLLPYLR